MSLLQRLLPLLKPLLLLGLAYGLASALLAWVLPPDATVVEMDGLLVQLVPKRSLPFALDPAVFGSQGTIQVGEQTPVRAKAVFLSAPQTDVCPLLHIGVLPAKADGALTIELLPARQPERRDASAPLPIAEGERGPCSIDLAVDGRDFKLTPAASAKLVLAPGSKLPLFEAKPVSAIRGRATRMTGGLPLAPADASRAPALELASSWMELTSVVAGPRSALTVTVNTLRPDRFLLDGHSQRPAWWLHRWGSFVMRGKCIVELFHAFVPG